MSKMRDTYEQIKGELIGTEFQDMDLGKWMAVLRRALGEMFATATLMFIGCMGTVNLSEKEAAPTHFNVAFNFGIAVMAGLITFGHVSGAHMNPGLSLTAMILGKLSFPMWLVYSVFQCLGGIVGVGLLYAITPQGKLSDAFCCSFPNKLLTGPQQFLSEFIFSGLLSLLACAVWDRRNLDKHDSVTLRFGLAVFAIAFGGVQYSGCSMNPARSLGPALLADKWDSQWLYWVAPLLANFVVAFVYRIIFPEPALKTE